MSVEILNSAFKKKAGKIEYVQYVLLQNHLQINTLMEYCNLNWIL